MPPAEAQLGWALVRRLASGDAAQARGCWPHPQLPAQRPSRRPPCRFHHHAAQPAPSPGSQRPPVYLSRPTVASMVQEMGPRANTSARMAAAPATRPCSDTTCAAAGAGAVGRGGGRLAAAAAAAAAAAGSVAELRMQAWLWHALGQHPPRHSPDTARRSAAQHSAAQQVQRSTAQQAQQAQRAHQAVVLLHRGAALPRPARVALVLLVALLVLRLVCRGRAGEEGGAVVGRWWGSCRGRLGAPKSGKLRPEHARLGLGGSARAPMRLPPGSRKLPASLTHTGCRSRQGCRTWLHTCTPGRPSRPALGGDAGSRQAGEWALGSSASTCRCCAAVLLCIPPGAAAMATCSPPAAHLQPNAPPPRTWQLPAWPQSITFCTDRYAEGQAPPRLMLMRSAMHEVAPCAQQEPQYWGMCCGHRAGMGKDVGERRKGQAGAPRLARPPPAPRRGERCAPTAAAARCLPAPPGCAWC